MLNALRIVFTKQASKREHVIFQELEVMFNVLGSEVNLGRDEARRAGKSKILKGSISSSQEFELYPG